MVPGRSISEPPGDQKCISGSIPALLKPVEDLQFISSNTSQLLTCRSMTVLLRTVLSNRWCLVLPYLSFRLSCCAHSHCAFESTVLSSAFLFFHLPPTCHSFGDPC